MVCVFQHLGKNIKPHYDLHMFSVLHRYHERNSYAVFVSHHQKLDLEIVSEKSCRGLLSLVVAFDLTYRFCNTINAVRFLVALHFRVAIRNARFFLTKSVIEKDLAREMGHFRCHFSALFRNLKHKKYIAISFFSLFTLFLITIGISDLVVPKIGTPLGFLYNHFLNIQKHTLHTVSGVMTRLF